MTADEKLHRGKPRILIVDDLELNRAILCELFCKEYEVLEAENGQEAIDVLEEQSDSIQVVLLDIVMPILDGFGVLDKMSQKGWIGRIPVIMNYGRDIRRSNAEGDMRWELPISSLSI